jgi:hypothetical protein
VGRGILAATAAIAGTALAALVQAVDGSALKSMVDRWFGAPAETRTAAFEAAMAVNISTMRVLAVVWCLCVGVRLLRDCSV